MWPSAAISALLFTSGNNIGNLAVSFHLARAATGSVLGAESTRVLAQRRTQRSGRGG